MIAAALPHVGLILGGFVGGAVAFLWGYRTGGRHERLRQRLREP
jgi:hypothetical protein